jgi:tripartite-type tricarboxylate transporter receptor subunit TctC
MIMQRRQFTASVALACAPISMLAQRANAQGIAQAKILCGFPAGGTADALSRRLAEALRPSYANVVIVDNKPGAGGGIALIALRDSPADGSVLCVSPSSPVAMNRHTFKSLPYKPLEDAMPASLLCEFDHALVVGPAVPATVTTVKDYLAWIKAGNIAGYGTPGVAGIPHLVGVMLARQSGVELVNIAYRGSAPAVQDLLGGQVPAVIAPVGDSLAYAESGKIRFLAVAGPSRSKFVPNVPTLRESGFDVAARDWFGVFMPPKSAPDAVSKASTAVRSALELPTVKTAFSKLGMDAAGSAPSALSDRIVAEDAIWGRVVKAVGFVPEG